jgi:hypothetical protein
MPCGYLCPAGIYALRVSGALNLNPNAARFTLSYAVSGWGVFRPPRCTGSISLGQCTDYSGANSTIADYRPASRTISCAPGATGAGCRGLHGCSGPARPGGRATQGAVAEDSYLTTDAVSGIPGAIQNHLAPNVRNTLQPSRPRHPATSGNTNTVKIRYNHQLFSQENFSIGSEIHK